MTPEQAQEVLNALASIESDVHAIHALNQHHEVIESLLIQHIYTLYAVIGVIVGLGLIVLLAMGFSRFR